MSAFHGFPDLPKPGGDIPFCEVNGVYCCGNQEYGNISTFTNTTRNLPVVNVTRDHHYVRDEGISLYLDVEDNIFKKLTSVLYNEGLTEALKTAADPRVSCEYPLLANAACFALHINDALTRMRYFFQPHLKDLGPKLISKYSNIRNWQHSTIRCIAWHPHTTKVAVALNDDCVRIFKDGVTTLKCQFQKDVSAIAWRPCSASEIAVACVRGVVVWTVDPGSLYTKATSSNAQFLERSGHTPITDISWSPDGDLLVTASASDPAILVWDVAKVEAAVLRRVAGGGAVMARFSLDGARLFSATTSLVFRVWETEKRWSAERWCANNRVCCAAWGPNRTLLFATETEPIIFALSIGLSVYEDDTQATSNARPILNLAKVQTNNDEVVGGPILDLKWDPKGRHLAVLFAESSIIAVFNTLFNGAQMQVTPCCFVTGPMDDVPNVIAFQNNFDDGSNLTIGWSSGKVQYFPIIYTQEF